MADSLRAANAMEEETRVFENEVRIQNLHEQLAVVNQQQNMVHQFIQNLSQRVEVASPIVHTFFADNRITVQDNPAYQQLSQVHNFTVNHPVQVAKFLAQKRQSEPVLRNTRRCTSTNRLPTAATPH